MSSQPRLYQLLTSQASTPELLSLLIANGIDQPDTRFELAYNLYNKNPNTDQKYIQMQEIIYNGLSLRIDKNFVRKFVLAMKKRIGDCAYIRRLFRFVQFLASGDITLMQELLKDDLTDTETYKKTLAILKRTGRVDEYIEKLNKYLSIQVMDEQAWLQLAQVYIQKSHTMKSAFCYQQLILLSPQNQTYTIRLCELYLSLTNKKTTQKAIKYLLALITKRPDNLRALWLLYRTVIGNGYEEYADLKELCAQAINKLYSQRNPGLKIHLAL